MTSPTIFSLLYLAFSLSLSLSPFSLFLSLPASPPPPPSSLAEHCSDIIEGIWCKIRTPAKLVLDYLVMPPPHSGFKLNFSSSKMNPGQILINREICDWYPTAIISLWKAWLSGYSLCQQHFFWSYIYFPFPPSSESLQYMSELRARGFLLR